MGIRAERRAKQVVLREKAYVAELEKEKRTITCSNILKTCSECENHKVMDADTDFGKLGLDKKLSICKKGARKNMEYQIVEVPDKYPFLPPKLVAQGKIGFYPYGDVTAKCDFLIFMSMEDEKN